MTTRKTVSAVALAGAMALGMVTVVAAAQRNSGSQSPPNYDPATEITLSGTVESVRTVPGSGTQGGVHLVLKTDKETIEVDLGPSWFLEQQKYRFAAGDAITVIGVRAKMAMRPALIARQVKRGDATMTFRDEKGFPRWSRRGRG